MKKHALLIDADKRLVRPVLVENYEDIKEHCLVDRFDCVVLTDNRETLYIDDEGLINGTRKGFRLAVQEGKGFSRPVQILGNGLILGCDKEGDSVDTKLYPDDLYIEYFEMVNNDDEEINDDEDLI